MEVFLIYAHKEWLRKVKKDIASQSSPADIALRDFSMVLSSFQALKN